MYEGNVSKVIKEVVNEYAPGIELEISETDDNETNVWPMMRQDPKTFIQSLLDWSSSLVGQKQASAWIVASVDEKIVIKQLHELESQNLGVFTASFSTKNNDLKDFHLVSNVFVANIQTELITHGISAVSGKYLDRQTTEEFTVISDENTSSKINTKINSKLGFNKPEGDRSTSIMAVPELNGGEIGIKYEEYIGGRARNTYINMLPNVMRIKLSVYGNYTFDDSSKLGASVITLNWRDTDETPYFLSGNWILYGFNHVMEKGKGWNTDLYCYRIDHNASAKQRP